MSKKEDIQNQMMDYLYDEMDDQEKEAFEALMRTQPELQKELDELRLTRDLMSAHPTAVPPLRLDLNPNTDSKTGKQHGGRILNLTPFVRNLMAIAASLLIVILGMAFAGVETGSTENGYYVTIGNPPEQPPIAEPSLTEENVIAMLEQMKSDQALLFAGLMEEVQSQQNEQIDELFTLLTDYYEERRQQDLRMIAAGMNELEYETQNRFNRTNTALGSLIYALNNP
tara:strand:- start:12735 stop:13415 length:681 start_codon:yes stop_codon:yes gene_type:complete